VDFFRAIKSVINQELRIKAVMTLKKSKSGIKKSSKINEYKRLQDDIIDYAGRHNFHDIISHMLYGAYKEKSDDPFAYMINYLIERKGSKSESYGNQKLLTEIQEKDEEIKRLNDRITYLESLNTETNTNGTQLNENTNLISNASMGTTLSDLSGISAADLDRFAENPSFMRGFESKLATSTQAEQPMTSNQDVTILVPTNEHPAEQQQKANDLVLTFNINRLMKSELPANPEQSLENKQSSEETMTSNDTEEIAMEVSDTEINDKSIKEDMEITEKSSAPTNNFDDFEPDYEPEED
jgi:hypothetical protein